MVTKKIILVLGAGASAPFGYPLGEELSHEIYMSLNSGSTSGMRGCLLELDYDESLLNSFGHKLQYSALSIDMFLENNDHYRDVGRASIAFALIQRELENKLFDHRNSRNWYKYLFSKMNCELAYFDHNLISFVTFNYDRSLEHFLFTAARNNFSDVSCEKVVQKLNFLTIRHVYGSLGRLPWQKPSPHEFCSYERKYGTVLSPDIVSESSKCIKIVHDDDITKDPFILIQLLLEDAEAVYMIGFGYDATNLRRLGITENYSAENIFGTAYEMESGRRKHLSSKVPGICLDQKGYDAMGYLQNVVEFE